MDTAQRGGGLTWPAAQELIARALSESRARGGAMACGAGTDHLLPGPDITLEDVERAYAEQVGYVEQHGGRVILMASRALARAAKSGDDYRRVYGNILRQARQPVILHWLGDMFDPALAGYWGTRDLDAAMDVCLDVIAAHSDKVDGIKISLLDAQKEIDMRRRLPAGVRMYTGDDFNYAQLIRGDAESHSDALLGIFDGIAPAASAALQALDACDLDRYHAILEPTVPLSRHIFRAPTFAYKTGIVFLAYLNGHQDHFRMLGGAESARSVPHLAELIRLADAAGLLSDPERAASRARGVFAVAGNLVSSVAPLADVSRLSFNQATSERSSLREVVDSCARHGVPSVAIWRHKLAELGVGAAAQLVRGRRRACLKHLSWWNVSGGNSGRAAGAHRRQPSCDR